MTRYLLSDGKRTRDTLVDDAADLRGVFLAIDIDTSEELRVRGWLLVDVVEVR
ncbi:hypothetical protein ACFQ15_05700 [Sphingomonas hankookensis]|uniref:hypothetical protein n=1 Tax=Sphingomonas hankookensis TaxID=563996 RepID=UPI001F59FC46|nr:hypothetical protein [Sphingomonas hankookensis]